MNNISPLIKRYYPILVLLILLIIANIFSKNALTTAEFIAALASAGITAVGWIFSYQLNKTTFQRSEIIKNRDQVVSLVESFFNDLIPFFDKRETTEKDIEDFITDKIPEVENKVNQIQRVFKKHGIAFISAEKLALLQSEPLNIFGGEHKQAKNKLQVLKKNILSEIDTVYEAWLRSL